MNRLKKIFRFLACDDLIDRIAERDEKIAILEWENERMKGELRKRANTFFVSNLFLGFNRTIYGIIVDGELVKLHQEDNQ